MPQLMPELSHSGYLVVAVMPAVTNDMDVYVTAYAAGRAIPYVTWATTLQFGAEGFYAGHYFTDRADALTDMARRAGLAAGLPARTS